MVFIIDTDKKIEKLFREANFGSCEEAECVPQRIGTASHLSTKYMPIDTDDLSDKTYKAILSEAERFHHDLALQFALLSEDCHDEAMFINRSEVLVQEMMTYHESEMDDIFFDDPPSKATFRIALKRILGNISRLKK